MQALTMAEPWASLMAFGAKRYFTTRIPTHRRGPVAIHGGAVRFMDRESEFSRVARWYLRHVQTGKSLFRTGQIVAIADLQDCLTVVANTWDRAGRHVIAAEMSDGTVVDGDELTLGMWPIGMYVYRFGHIERIEPVQASNETGECFWEWEGQKWGI